MPLEFPREEKPKESFFLILQDITDLAVKVSAELIQDLKLNPLCFFIVEKGDGATVDLYSPCKISNP